MQGCGTANKSCHKYIRYTQMHAGAVPEIFYSDSKDQTCNEVTQFRTKISGCGAVSYSAQMQYSCICFLEGKRTGNKQCKHCNRKLFWAVQYNTEIVRFRGFYHGGGGKENNQCCLYPPFDHTIFRLRMLHVIAAKKQGLEELWTVACNEHRT